MRKFVFAILLVLANLQIKAQDYSKWSVGFNFTRSVNHGFLFTPSVNYEINKSIEVGIMPIFKHNESHYSQGAYSIQTSWGGTVTGKYYLYKENIMDPYTMLIFGYGSTNQDASFGNYNSNFVDFGLILGNELQLGEKGWNFDFNIGVLWTNLVVRDWVSSSPFISVGIKKRFLIK